MTQVTLQYLDLATKLGGVIGILWAVFRGVAELKHRANEASRSAASAEAQLWLELRQRFSEHDEIHLMLRNSTWPGTNPPWPKLESYLGLMEHCEAMMQRGLLDPVIYKQIYGYRLFNALDEPGVREKLDSERGGWTLLWQLEQRLNAA